MINKLEKLVIILINRIYIFFKSYIRKNYLDSFSNENIRNVIANDQNILNDEEKIINDYTNKNNNNKDTNCRENDFLLDIE